MKINEIFLSIQGEGILTGLPTIFIRTAGCNLRCSWCDTKFAYYQGKEASIKSVIKKIKKYKVKRVCITGGEPLSQEKEVIGLIKKLLKFKYDVSIETNGSLDIKKIPKKVLISLDIKCPSSRMSDKMLFRNLRYLKNNDEVNFVVGTKEDYDFAKKIVQKYNLTTKTNVFFTPVWGTNTKKLVNRILKDKLDVRLGLQVQKFIFGPDKRGV